MASTSTTRPPARRAAARTAQALGRVARRRGHARGSSSPVPTWPAGSRGSVGEHLGPDAAARRRGPGGGAPGRSSRRPDHTHRPGRRCASPARSPCKRDDGDPGLAAVWSRIRAGRLAGMSNLAANLAADGRGARVRDRPRASKCIHAATSHAGTSSSPPQNSRCDESRESGGCTRSRLRGPRGSCNAMVLEAFTSVTGQRRDRVRAYLGVDEGRGRDPAGGGGR